MLHANYQIENSFTIVISNGPLCTAKYELFQYVFGFVELRHVISQRVNCEMHGCITLNILTINISAQLY